MRLQTGNRVMVSMYYVVMAHDRKVQDRRLFIQREKEDKS